METTIDPRGIAPLREHRGGRNERQQFRDEGELSAGEAAV
jgi:hypothetical protein